MSETPTLPTKAAAEEAFSFLNFEIDSPAYFAKLAEHGIAPATEAEATQLWELGHQVQQQFEAGQIKLANAPIHPNAPGDNPFLASAINTLASQQPVAVKEAQADEFIGNQILQLVQNNELAKQAALLCAHVELGGELAEDPTAV